MPPKKATTINPARKKSRPQKSSPRPDTSPDYELDMYRLIMDSIYNGIMVTDAQGYITHFNEPYGQFLP